MGVLKLYKNDGNHEQSVASFPFSNQEIINKITNKIYPRRNKADIKNPKTI
jgi:hypothetical protein